MHQSFFKHMLLYKIFLFKGGIFSIIFAFRHKLLDICLACSLHMKEIEEIERPPKIAIES